MRQGLIVLPYLKQILRCRSNANFAQELALLLLERVAFIQMTVAPAHGWLEERPRGEVGTYALGVFCAVANDPMGWARVI